MNNDFTYKKDIDARVVARHTIPFSELTEKLKNKVRQYLREDDSFIDDDWHEIARDDIAETYANKIKITNYEFDMMRDEVSLEGIITSNPLVPSAMEDQIEKFKDLEWLDISTIRFTNDDVPPDYFIDEDAIEQYVGRQLFGIDSPQYGNLIISAENNSVEDFKRRLLERVSSGEYNDFSESLGLIHTWLNLCETAEIFFQDIEISKDDYNECLQPIIGDYVEKINTLVEKEYMPLHQEFADKVSSEYRNALLKTYAAYFNEDDYVDAILDGKNFMVGFDENGAQITIDNLKGESDN